MQNGRCQGPQSYKILLAFSGLRHSLSSKPGYNLRVAECQEAARILLKLVVDGIENDVGKKDSPWTQAEDLWESTEKCPGVLYKVHRKFALLGLGFVLEGAGEAQMKEHTKALVCSQGMRNARGEWRIAPREGRNKPGLW
eukprot:Gb_26806 [translate_table: standard]